MPHTPQTQQVMFHVSCHQIPVNIPRDKDLRENAHCPDFCFICCCAVWVFFLRIALVSAMLLMLLLLPPAAAFCRCLLRRLCRGSIAASALSLQRLLRHCSFGYCLLCLCSFLGFFFCLAFFQPRALHTPTYATAHCCAEALQPTPPHSKIRTTDGSTRTPPAYTHTQQHQPARQRTL